MTNVTHASLTGASLHEPKGIESALSGQVYVANGASTGAWTSIDSTAFTGVVSDFLAMTAPSGWLELDGSTISTTTYANLFGVMSLSQSGTRTNGSAIVTSLGSTSTIKAGYYVFGTGITSGTTVLSVDSSSQITMSANAGSSGTSTVIVSPWLLNTGTIKLPDLVTAGRYRRARLSGQAIGTLQADTINSHTHLVSGTSGSQNAQHSHNGTTGSQNADHTHAFGITTVTNSFQLAATPGISSVTAGGASSTSITQGQSGNHQHTFTTDLELTSHQHAISITSAANASAGAETRPVSMVFITCVKT